jgi:hypothetical protein
MANPFKPQRASGGRRGVVNAQEARDIATEAFLFLVSDQKQLVDFLGQSGLDPTSLSARARDPETLVFVLDYVQSNESLLLAFSANSGHKPETIAAAAHVIGGPPPQWSS